MNNKDNTDFHSPLSLCRQTENKNQYAPITESFRGKIKLLSSFFLRNIVLFQIKMQVTKCT